MIRSLIEILELQTEIITNRCLVQEGLEQKIWLTSSKLQPCSIKQPLKTEKSYKKIKLCIKIQSIAIFLDITKATDFR